MRNWVHGNISKSKIDRQYNAYTVNKNLLSFLKLVRHRGGVEPDDHESKEPSDDCPKTGDPNPAAGDNPAARELIMSEMADGDLMLLLDSGEKGPFVVDTEREDTVLIGCHELGAKDGAGICATDRLESQAVEGREHGKLQLELVSSGNLEWNPLVVDIFRNLNVVDLSKRRSVVSMYIALAEAINIQFRS